jgi:hydroxyacylglutathione hydrolase
MKVVKVRSEGLAHNSYYISSKGEAAVIDPRRDTKIYSKLAKEDCSKIRYIFETHRNEDYVIGSLELQSKTNAQICHSKELPFKYGEHRLSEDEALSLGNIKIKTLYTPGHTNESLSYVFIEENEPQAVFTGDALFAGSVGRTDLYGKQAQKKQTEKLYNSLHEKILKLGEGVLVYPAHGTGSICGSKISGYEPTTIGYEKRTNPYLQLGKEEFIQKSENEQLIVPHYFKQIEELNLNGPPSLSNLSYPESYRLLEFEKEMQTQKTIVIDTRLPYAFAGAHIPNTLSIWLDGTSVYPGWLMDINQYILLILERPEDVNPVTTRFRRLGFVNICGYLCGGMNTWQEAGKPIQNFITISAAELANKLNREELRLIDVREPQEWKDDGYIQTAQLIPFFELPDKANSIPRDKTIAVTCSVGNRSSTALSILERAGFKQLINVLGGVTAWSNLNYPIKKK